MEKSLPVHLIVPVRPAVEKYLRCKLRLGPEGAFHLTKRVTVGRLLYHLLRNPQLDSQYNASVAAYSGRLLVHVSRRLAWHNSAGLTSLGAHDFNRQVEGLIEAELHVTLDTLRSYGVAGETKAQTLRFMEQYDFTEDDITLDALLKSYYRYRN